MINPRWVLLRTEPGETDFQLLRASQDSVTEFALTTIRGGTCASQGGISQSSSSQEGGAC